MKHEELEKKIAEVFEGFELETIKVEYVRGNNNVDLAKYGMEVETGSFTEITISGVVKERK